MSNGLVPCPECGSENLIHEPVDLADYGTGWLVACEDCGHEGPTCLSVGAADYWWNRRAETNHEGGTNDE